MGELLGGKKRCQDRVFGKEKLTAGIEWEKRKTE